MQTNQVLFFMEIKVFTLSLCYNTVSNAVYNVLHCQTACEPNTFNM